MTIRNCINAAELNKAWSNLERCSQEAPEGAYQEAKALAELIGATASKLIRDVRALGLKADNCDLIREVEAVIYGYVRDSNPEAYGLMTAEGFGEHIDGPARDRVRANCSRDLDTLRGLGVIQ